MLPVIAIAGRPNVGKSTLFNRLTGTRDAIVADYPGLTRDRRYGTARHHGARFIVVDTGGLTGDSEDLATRVGDQVRRALDEADRIVLLTDARAGRTAGDEAIADRVRRLGKPVVLAVNKTDGLDERTALSEFHALGLDAPTPISAAHGRGIAALVRTLVPAGEDAPDPAGDAEADADGGRGAVRIAIIGRPNAGKSTLVNRLLGEDRVITDDAPGTTRDSVFVPFERGGRRFVLIDTAGLRRRSRVSDVAEKLSAIKALQAIEAANVAILVLDAGEGVSEQDARLLGYLLDAGRALVIALNKWDRLDPGRRTAARDAVSRRLGFIDFSAVHAISALRGEGLGAVMRSVEEAWAAATTRMAAGELTRIVQDATARHPPPAVRGRRIKLRYAHQGGINPPIVVIHGNSAEEVPQPYARYLARAVRTRFGLRGTPLRIEFRSGENPYAGRRNRLTPRQAPAPKAPAAPRTAAGALSPRPPPHASIPRRETRQRNSPAKGTSCPPSGSASSGRSSTRTSWPSTPRAMLSIFNPLSPRMIDGPPPRIAMGISKGRNNDLSITGFDTPTRSKVGRPSSA